METTNTTICENCGCVDEELFELEIDGEVKSVCADCAERNGYRQCDDCGEWVIEDDGFITATGSFVCVDCVDNYITCDDCGKLIPEDDIFDINPGFPYRHEGHVCEECANRHYYQCDDCGNWFSSDFIREDRWGHTICDSCFDDNYVVCARCGEIIPADDANWRGDYCYCDDCDPGDEDSRDFHDYSYKPAPDFQFRSSELEKLGKTLGHVVSGYEAQKTCLTFGVELEVDKGDDRSELCSELVELDQPIYMKHDGSLGSEGVEIVTHPCSLAYHMYELRWAEISRVCKANNYKSHDAVTCGLHIHVGRWALGESKYDRDTVEARLILLADRFRRELTTFSRRGEEQLNQWASFAGAYIDRTMSEEDLRSSAIGADGGSRYHAVNICPDATVELRLFRGTLKRDTLIASLQLVNNLVKYAMTHSCKECAFEASWTDILAVEQFKELNTYAAQRGLM